MLHFLTRKVSNLLVRGYSAYHSSQFRSAGPKVFLGFPSRIRGSENMIIGSDVSIKAPSYIYAEEGELVIKSRIRVNSNVVIGASHGHVVIGNDVLIGPNVVIRASNHGATGGQPIRSQGHIRGSITIGNDVWIGANCIILDGAVIGDGCILGAGSLCNGYIEPGTIAFGSPAKSKMQRA